MPTFSILKHTSYGRLGVIDTAHGKLETPMLFFCATSGALKGMSTDTAKKLNTQGILSNTYHLLDDADNIQALGGLHKFLDWQGPIMSDSGGFQAFSLGHGSVVNEIKRQGKTANFVQKIDDNCIVFKNFRNGALQYLTPELAIQTQCKLNVDLMFVLDECTPFHVDRDYIARSLDLTNRWAVLCLEEFKKQHISMHEHDQSTSALYQTASQGLYGIVQGSTYQDLRVSSIMHLNQLDFFGYGIGGSLGNSRADMVKILELCAGHVKPDRPVHLLGIGKIQDIIQAVTFNIDTFDCVHPTRIARHGGAIVSRGLWTRQHTDTTACTWLHETYKEHIVLTNLKYKSDPGPIDPTCDCRVCASYSRAYIYHLFKKREMLGMMLLMEHNVRFMNRFFEQLRAALRDGYWDEFVQAWS